MLGNCPLNSSHFIAFDAVKNYFLSWFLLLVNVMSLGGSGLCICVIIRYKVFTRSTRIWFLALAVSDIMTILVATFDFYLSLIFVNSHRSWMGYLGFFGCQIRYGAIVAVSWTGNMLQAGFSIERSISIISPFHARTLLKQSRSKMVIILLTVTSLTSGFFVNMVSMEFNITNRECHRKEYTEGLVSITKLVYYLDLIIFRTIPILIIIIGSFTIAILMKHRARQLQHSRHSNRRTSSESTNKEKNSSRRESQAFTLLLLMNFIALITNPLFLLFELIDGEGSEQKESGKLSGDKCLSVILTTIFNCLMYTNSFTNWIFYIVIGTRFKRFAAELICRFCEKYCICLPSRKPRRTKLSVMFSQTNRTTLNSISTNPGKCSKVNLEDQIQDGH